MPNTVPVGALNFMVTYGVLLRLNTPESKFNADEPVQYWVPFVVDIEEVLYQISLLYNEVGVESKAVIVIVPVVDDNQKIATTTLIPYCFPK